MKHLILLLLLFCQIQLLAQRPELVAPVGHTRQVNSAVFSPDGQYVLTGSSDETAKLWDLEGRELKSFRGHTSEVKSAVFSPDGQYVLTGSWDRTAKLWDLEGRELKSFRGHTEGVMSVSFSPDGQYILTGSYDGTAKLWNHEGRELKSLQGHTGEIFSVAFSPDGQYVLTGSADQTAKLWNLEGRELQSFRGHGNEIKSVAFSPDGQSVLSGSSDGTAKLWDLSGKEIQSFWEYPGIWLAAAFSPDGQYVLTANAEIRLWDLSGKKIRSFRAQNSRLRFLSATFSPDGQYVLTGNSDGTAKLWNLEGQELQSFQGYSKEVSSVAYSPDGQSVFTGSLNGPGMLWNLQKQEIKTFSGHKGAILSVSFSPDGQYVLTGSRDNTAKLWNLQGRELQHFEGHTGGIWSVAFSPDGQYVLTGSDDNSAKLWDLQGRELQNIHGHTSLVASAIFSPDGQHILTCSWDKTMKLWDLQNREVKSFQGHTGGVTSAAFSPDGQYILTSSYDGSARLWDLQGHQLKSFQDHPYIVWDATFSPDGKYVLTGNRRAIKLWNLQGQELRTFSAHGRSISSMAFSPDGRYLLTGGNAAKLWNLQSGQEIATLFNVSLTDLVVTTPSGLFDASPGAMRRMHYVQGLEVIALAQLKERYYEPGLLAKLMGYNPEPIRDVRTVDQPLELYPEVELTLQGDRLDVRLNARSGGIGRVALYIDNKEVLDDIDPSRSQTIQVDLDRYERYFQVGQPAQVGIQAWDRAGSLASQVRTTPYTPQAGAKGNPSAAAPPETGGGTMGQPIRLFALCIGSGDYSGGTALDLSYAEQDAQQMARALELAGAALFLAAPPQVQVLTTCKDCPDPAVAEYPSKAKIQRALADIAQQAGPQDVVVLYLSGHGITYEDYWYYLTPEMSSSVLTDNVVREQRTISSSELKEWMANIPARKQVMIIDACASGQLNQDFDLLAQKDIPSSQIRALNRLGSRAGLYVISASTADQVSYEASPYGMGLLTYGLLQGMLGAALRESEYIDVNLLFSYAEDQVPKFADYIGKAQKPMIYTPESSESFDIGRVTAAVKQGIELAEPKPLFARANFVNPKQQYRDDLKLSNAVNAALRDYNYQGQKSPLIFVEASDLPQAYALTGAYTVDGESINLEATVFKGEEQIGDSISLTGSTADLPGLCRKLIAEAAGRVR